MKKKKTVTVDLSAPLPEIDYTPIGNESEQETERRELDQKRHVSPYVHLYEGDYAWVQLPNVFMLNKPEAIKLEYDGYTIDLVNAKNIVCVNVGKIFNNMLKMLPEMIDEIHDEDSFPQPKSADEEEEADA